MKNLWISLKITLAMCIVLGVGYVLVLRGVSAVAGPNGGEADVVTLDGQVVGLIGLHLQFHLHHANWIGEIQELVVMPQARGLTVGSQLLAWAEATAREAGAEMTELSTSTQRLNAHRFYQREGYTQSHFRFTKPL